jgi:hypothetical protein
MTLLKETGALVASGGLSPNGGLFPSGGLSPLGRLMAQLPLEPFVSKVSKQTTKKKMDSFFCFQTTDDNLRWNFAVFVSCECYGRRHNVPVVSVFFFVFHFSFFFFF